MANPQKENGYTPIANEILEALAQFDFRGCTRNMLDVIIRKTYGFNKRRDKISISQFQEATKKSRRSVIYALQELEAKHLILVEHDGRNMSTYELNKNYKQWLVQNYAPQAEANRIRAKVASAKLRASAKLSKSLVQNSVNDGKSFALTKDTITKDTITKESTSSKKITPGQYAEMFFTQKTTQIEVIDHIVKAGKYNSQLVLSELPEFISYWTQLTQSGNKQLWQTEKAFDVSRRLSKWLKNKRDWSKPQSTFNHVKQDYPRNESGMVKAFDFCGKCDHGFIDGHPCSCVNRKVGSYE